ncbi:hypothetical protein ACKWRH_32195 [Bradyrhizobium sp. Pa8]|uniref:hypothetical protein n=1 Tax=Bradyrhizobium sp. Pa8 TaxID=3386552 RepID=UPI00403F7474
MTPFGVVVVCIIGILFAVALATPVSRQAFVGRARQTVSLLVWLALLVLLVSLFARIGW